MVEGQHEPLIDHEALIMCCRGKLKSRQRPRAKTMTSLFAGPVKMARVWESR